MEQTSTRRVLIVGGFCEHPALLMPLRYALSKDFDRVEIWNDAIVCRNLDNSVIKLRDAIQRHENHGETVLLVTHSFGDWIARQALLELSDHRERKLVSIAPIMAASPIAKILNLACTHWIS